MDLPCTSAFVTKITRSEQSSANSVFIAESAYFQRSETLPNRVSGGFGTSGKALSSKEQARSITNCRFPEARSMRPEGRHATNHTLRPEAAPKSCHAPARSLESSITAGKKAHINACFLWTRTVLEKGMNSRDTLETRFFAQGTHPAVRWRISVGLTPYADAVAFMGDRGRAHCQR
jgi:hypothetical protein